MAWDTTTHQPLHTSLEPSDSPLTLTSRRAASLLYVGVRRWRLTTDDTHATPQPDAQPTRTDRQPTKRRRPRVPCAHGPELPYGRGTDTQTHEERPELPCGRGKPSLGQHPTPANPTPNRQTTTDRTDRQLLLRAARLVAAAPLSPPSSAVAVGEALWTPPVPSPHNRGLPRVWASLLVVLLCCPLYRRTVRSPLRRYSARSVSNDTAESPTDVVFSKNLRGTNPQATDCTAGTTSRQVPLLCLPDNHNDTRWRGIFVSHKFLSRVRHTPGAKRFTSLSH